MCRIDATAVATIRWLLKSFLIVINILLQENGKCRFPLPSLPSDVIALGKFRQLSGAFVDEKPFRNSHDL